MMKVKKLKVGWNSDSFHLVLLIFLLRISFQKVCLLQISFQKAYLLQIMNLMDYLKIYLHQIMAQEDFEISNLRLGMEIQKLVFLLDHFHFQRGCL
jgi:hypothetical protein